MTDRPTLPTVEYCLYELNEDHDPVDCSSCINLRLLAADVRRQTYLDAARIVREKADRGRKAPSATAAARARFHALHSAADALERKAREVTG